MSLPPYVAPERPARLGPGAAVVLGAGLAAALVAGSFAVVSLRAPDGRSSPEAAVEALVAAVEDADALGVLESLAPGERRSLRPGLEDVVTELERLGVVEEGFRLGAVPGVDVRVDDLALEAEALADDLSAVRITGGTITTSIEPDELPLGPVVRELLEEGELDTAATTEDLADGDAVVVAVEEGGGWHVSLWYSLAETARRSAGEDIPAFGRGVVPRGAGSPEAAVREALEAAVDLDAERLVGLTPPGEMRALHDYAPLFLDDAAEDAEELRAEGYDLALDRFAASTRRDGDEARVVIEDLAVSGRLPDEGEVVLASDGECVRWESEEGPDERCADGLDLAVATVEVDGAWYLSPTRTTLDLLAAGLRLVDRDDLEDPDALFGGFFGVGPGEEDFEDEDLDLEDLEDLQEGSFPTLAVPPGSGVGDCFGEDVGGELRPLPCGTPHTYEAFAEVPPGAEPFGTCDEAAFEAFVGVEYLDSAFFTELLEDDGRLLCALYEPGEQLVGTARGAGR